MVSDRSLEVLKVIVQDYVATREPVGSKSIVDRHAFGVSAATIRNDMAMLEDEELIVAPHTSSGRVPTDKGYRLFVDHLAEVRPLSAAQRQAIETFLGGAADLDEVLARSVRLLSTLTNQVALVQYPSLASSHVRHIELVPLADTRLISVVITDSGRVEQRVVDVSAVAGAEASGPLLLDEAFLGELRAKLNTALAGLAVGEAAQRLEGIAGQFRPERRAQVSGILSAVLEQLLADRQDRLLMAGTANLARTEEDFSGSIYPVLEAIEEQVTLLKLFSEMEADDHDVAASIGRENAGPGLVETSVVTSGYSSPGGVVARLGVLGPTRMDYPTTMAAVRAVARYLSRLLGED